MRSLAWAFVLCLLLTAYAGCAEQGSTKSQEKVELGSARSVKSVNRTELEKRLNRSIATSGQAELGDWFVLAAATGPQGNLTGFRFRPPEGSLLSSTSGRVQELAFEVVPIVMDSSGGIQDWLLAAYVLDQGRARFLYSENQIPRTAPSFVAETPRKIADLALPTPSVMEQAVSTAPLFLRLSDPQIGTGPIHFVVAARSPNPAPFGIALRQLDHRPAPAEQPHQGLDEFLADMGRSIPFGLPRTGSGNGFVVARYEASTTLPLNATKVIGHYDMRTPEARIEDRVAVRNVPALTVRDTTVSGSLDSTGGWTYARGVYTGLCATGKWSAQVQAHGKTYMPRSLILQHVLCSGLYPYLAEYVLFGQANFVFEHEGTGDSKVSLEIQVANISVESLTFLYISLGAPLQTLLGYPSVSRQIAHTGLVGNVPPGLHDAPDPTNP